MKPMEKNLASLGKSRTLKKGDFLFHAEDAASGFFYLEEGEIRIFKMDEQGKEVEVVRIRPGDFFGEAIVFVQEKFPSYAQAVKESRALYFEKDAFFAELEKNPSLAKFFLTLLAKKCVVLNQRIEALELRTVRQRLIQYLISSCKGQGRCVIELPIRKGELAKLLGTISETLSRNLKQLQDEGLIRVRGSSIQVPDCSRLKEELGGKFLI
jgi:CRP-like cAMP-binding protein